MKTQDRTIRDEIKKIKKYYPKLAEGMLAHCISTTVPDEPDGSSLKITVMPIGFVLEWIKIAEKQHSQDLVVKIEEYFGHLMNDGSGKAMNLPWEQVCIDLLKIIKGK